MTFISNKWIVVTVIFFQSILSLANLTFDSEGNLLDDGLAGKY